MEIDHEYIAGYIDRLVEMTLELSPRKVPEFQRLGWELVAILKLHFDKEERVYLPLLDAKYTEKEVQTRIVEKMDLFEEAKWAG
jgi:hemerythrin-like domain-containing protein